MDDNDQSHGITQSFCLDQAQSLIGYKVQFVCKYNNINIITAPPNDHRAIGLVEILIQTIKRRLTCMKLGCKSSTLTVKEPMMSIAYDCSAKVNLNFLIWVTTYLMSFGVVSKIKSLTF